MALQMGMATPKVPAYVGRPASASTATASMAVHQEETRDILDRAFSGYKNSP
jgi:2-oxoglutarate dehydrogenase complex dehydrogenase (E1) component-like enzyme